MSEALILEITRDLLVTAAYLAAPAILTSMVIGAFISLLQTITSVQEQTLSFAPRMFAVFAAILLTVPWSIQVAMGFTMRMIEIAARITQ